MRFKIITTYGTSFIYGVQKDDKGKTNNVFDMNNL